MKQKQAWHLTLIAIVFLLIYLIGLYDFIMVNSNNELYFTRLNGRGDIKSYFNNYPTIFTIFWIFIVFLDPIAAILLLFKSNWTIVVAFVVAFSKFCLDTLSFLFRERWEVFGPQMALTDLAVLALSIAFYFYCRKMKKIGILN